MQLINILLQITLFLIMVSVGSSIKLSEIKEIFKKPKKMIVGLALQMIAFPLIAIIISIMAPISPLYKIGIIILAACPGGTLSNFISYLIKADVPLSVGLTSTNSFITILTIPLYTSIAFKLFLNNVIKITLPISQILSQIILIVILPVAIGITLRKIKENKITKLQKPIKITSSFLLLIVFTIKFLGNPNIGGSQITGKIFLDLFPYLLLLNILGLLTGYLVSRKIKLPRESSTTLGIEVGLQNTVLALLITDVALKNTTLGHPALVYATFTFITTFLFAIITIKEKPVKTLRQYLSRYNLAFKKYF